MTQKNKLEELATKGDIKLLGNDIKFLEDSLSGKIQEMREEHEKYKDEVMTKLDDISGQLGNLRDENIIGAHQTSQLREQTDNHEKRIKHLEKIPQTA